MRRKRILIGLFPVFFAMAIKRQKHTLEERGAVLYQAGVGTSDVACAAGLAGVGVNGLKPLILGRVLAFL